MSGTLPSFVWEFLIEEFKAEVNTTEGKNRELHEDVLLQFIVTAYVGVVEWWITNGVMQKDLH